MPSLMRSVGNASSDDDPVLTCDWNDPPVGLAAFRTRIDIEHSRSLSSLIESEIIPRLMMAHAVDLPAPVRLSDGDCGAIDPAEVAEIVPMALQVEADALLAHVEAILARGISVDTVMIDLLAPAARMLGKYWEEDRCDFIDVTMGLWRLQEIVHEIAVPASPRRHGGHSRSALFASMPGDQHNFGTVVVEEVFRRHGWETARLNNVEAPDLLKRVAEDWFDLVGLTISCDCHIGQLPSLILGMRSVARNSSLCVMVGGGVLVANPDLAVQLGADGTACDAKVALQIADTLVHERSRGAVQRR
ncbi:cobalamin B12-binding domain-containing protein [Sphingomonas sp. RS6]